jgi:hypothetical protein
VSPFARVAEPEEIAAVVTVLAGADAEWISGAVLDTNGAVLPPLSAPRHAAVHDLEPRLAATHGKLLRLHRVMGATPHPRLNIRATDASATSPPRNNASSRSTPNSPPDRPTTSRGTDQRTRRTLARAHQQQATGDWHPLFPNPVVAESLLDRLINTQPPGLHERPSYRPNKQFRSVADDKNTTTQGRTSPEPPPAE